MVSRKPVTTGSIRPTMSGARSSTTVPQPDTTAEHSSAPDHNNGVESLPSSDDEWNSEPEIVENEDWASNQVHHADKESSSRGDVPPSLRPGAPPNTAGVKTSSETSFEAEAEMIPASTNPFRHGSSQAGTHNAQGEVLDIFHSPKDVSLNDASQHGMKQTRGDSSNSDQIQGVSQAVSGIDLTSSSGIESSGYAQTQNLSIPEITTSDFETEQRQQQEQQQQQQLQHSSPLTKDPPSQPAGNTRLPEETPVAEGAKQPTTASSTSQIVDNILTGQHESAERFEGQTSGVVETSTPISELPATSIPGNFPISQEADDPPPKPPRPTDPETIRISSREPENPPSQPPRPAEPNVSQQQPTTSASSQPNIYQQTNETYQIKHINWIDHSSSEALRTSPVLIQNANGPCPLLALVNALTLSTPLHAKTALTETLRVREQVSLGLLLDAVFDELMSGRRGDQAQALPDVSELYQFLVNLHTGMNVNPRLVASISENLPNLMDAPEGALSTEDGTAAFAGTFEQTKEMRLYSTFSIPLIHGWLPPPTHPAYAAFERSAQTYEDAQNLMFSEEELEERLQSGSNGEGLSTSDQQLLQDISTIKYFFAQSATQITPFGLDAILKGLQPGRIAILFRNDHFSTLYRHPVTGSLLQLVTDAGYSSHDEVVWESLVDVNGMGTEFYSGDFRSVGNSGASGAPTVANESYDDAGWTTVDGRGQRQSRQAGTSRSQASGNIEVNSTARASSATSPTRGRLNDDLPPLPIATTAQTTSHTGAGPTDDDEDIPLQSPQAEQEDHDLALALQLQEEEEDRHRREVAARERERNLSERLISEEQSQSARGGRGRGRASSGSNTRSGRSDSSTSTQGQTIRPLIPPRRSNPQAQGRREGPAAPQPTNPEAGIDAPPPTYEQAAGADPYFPPVNHPFHPTSSADSRPPHLTRDRSSSAAQRPLANAPTPSNPSQPQPHHLRLGQSGPAPGPDWSRRGRGAGPSRNAPAPPSMRRPNNQMHPPLPNPAVGHTNNDRDKDCTIM